MKLRFRTRTIAISAAIAVVGSGVGAYAFWTQSGSGTGSASTGTTTAITVNQTGAAITGMFPGGTPLALAGNFTNTNSGGVKISSVTATVHAFSSTAGDVLKPACTQADYAIGGTAAGSTVPVGTGVGSWSGLTVALLNGVANQDNCKGIVVTIDYLANV